MIFWEILAGLLAVVILGPMIVGASVALFKGALSQIHSAPPEKFTWCGACRSYYSEKHPHPPEGHHYPSQSIVIHEIDNG